MARAADCHYVISTTDAIAHALTSAVPTTPSEVKVAARQGMYAWWCRTEDLIEFHPSVPSVRPLDSPDGWSLLYVGIGPVREGSRTLRERLVKDHQSGSIGGSTLRQSLAALLRDSIGLTPRAGSDRARLVTEAPLSAWMAAHLGLTVVGVERPWLIEHDIITTLAPPLNIQGGVHPFRFRVQEARAQLRRACGC